MSQHSINLTKIKNIFANTHVSREYQVYTTDGVYSFPADQPWSQELYERLSALTGVPSGKDKIAMHADVNTRLGLQWASWALVVVWAYQYLKPFINGEAVTIPYVVAVTLFSLPIALFVAFAGYIPYFKIPLIFRGREKDLYFLDYNGEHVVPKDSITNVQRFGSMVKISTRQKSWFLPAFLMFDPANPLLPAKKLSVGEKAKIANSLANAFVLETKPARLLK